MLWLLSRILSVTLTSINVRMKNGTIFILSCLVFFFLFRLSEVSAELPTLLTGGSLSYLRRKRAHALVWTAKSVPATYRLIARLFCE